MQKKMQDDARYEVVLSGVCVGWRITEGQGVLSSNQNTVFTDIWDSELPIPQGPDSARVTFRLKGKLWMLDSVLYIAQHQSKKEKKERKKENMYFKQGFASYINGLRMAFRLQCSLYTYSIAYNIFYVFKIIFFYSPSLFWSKIQKNQYYCETFLLFKITFYLNKVPNVIYSCDDNATFSESLLN